MCSRLILKIAGKKERQPTSTEPGNDSLYEDQYSVPLPPIQVTRNKSITYSYTIWDSVSLDTGFLATAFTDLWVVLSFNARQAIPHNTGLINHVATAIYVIKKDYMLYSLEIIGWKKFLWQPKLDEAVGWVQFGCQRNFLNSVICKLGKHVVLLLINII